MRDTRQPSSVLGGLGRACLLGIIACLAAVSIAGYDAFAAEHTSRPHPSFTLSDQDAKASMQWLADLAVRELPSTFSGDKDWGATREIWAGVRVRREGLRIKTKRRKKEVRHGRWLRYELNVLPTAPSSVRPSGPVRVLVDDVEQIEDGSWRLRCSTELPMKFDIRVERWRLGVQWYSVNFEGDMRVRLTATAAVDVVADYREVPPALVVEPVVEQAEIDLKSFEINKISKLGGDAAEGLGDWAESTIRATWLRKENTKLADRFNRQIDKRRDDLRWSMQDWLVALSQSADDDSRSAQADD